MGGKAMSLKLRNNLTLKVALLASIDPAPTRLYLVAIHDAAFYAMRVRNVGRVHTSKVVIPQLSR